VRLLLFLFGLDLGGGAAALAGGGADEPGQGGGRQPGLDTDQVGVADLAGSEERADLLKREGPAHAPATHDSERFARAGSGALRGHDNGRLLALGPLFWFVLLLDLG